MCGELGQLQSRQVVVKTRLLPVSVTFRGSLHACSLTFGRRGTPSTSNFIPQTIATEFLLVVVTVTILTGISTNTYAIRADPSV